MALSATGVRVRLLKHGGVLHGAQYLEGARAMTASTYYGPGSGIDHALRALPDRPARRIGVVGLGAGTMAAYGRAGDTIRFYEIHPQKIHLARTYFTFLTKSPATMSATWILLSPDGVEYWTDDYSNLWHLLGPPKRYPCTSADAPPRTPTSGYTATVWQARHGAVYDTPHTSQRG